MKRLTESQLTERVRKDRGMYFNFAITKPLAEKYNISHLMVNEIRRFGVYERKSKQKTIEHINDRLEKGYYDVNFTKSRTWKDPKRLKTVRIAIRDFLLNCSDEDYEDIVRLTKWDWDFKGEHRKLPVL